MASYHCTVKAGVSASGGEHAAYIEREGKYAKKKGTDLEAAESGNMPAWAATSAEFLAASDANERANAKGYREYEVALPREFTPEQRLALVREFVQQELAEHTYTFAIHNPKAALDGGEQPHAHIMFSERKNDGIARPAEQYFRRYNAKNPEKGGCRKGDGAKTPTERKAELVALRERWAALQNRHLEMHGKADRVDHRSLADQGIDREPEQHLGPKAVQGKQDAVELVKAARADRALAIVLATALAAAKRRLARLEAVAKAAMERLKQAPASPPVARDPVDDVADLMERVAAEISAVQIRATEQEARSQREADQRARDEESVRQEMRAMVAPGALSLPSTRRRFEAQVADAQTRGQAALDAQHAALARVKEARAALAAPRPIALARVAREYPDLTQHVQALLKARPELNAMGVQRVREREEHARQARAQRRVQSVHDRSSRADQASPLPLRGGR